jgi:hypothetical protein
MVQKLLLSFFMLAASAPLAAAQSLQNTLTDSGLLGRWAPDCAAAASNRNIHSIYVVEPSGQAAMIQESGPGKPPTRTPIVAVRRIPPDRVEYEVIYDDGARIRVVLIVTERQIRAWHSQQSTGEVLIENGRFRGNGQETPVRIRCG